MKETTDEADGFTRRSVLRKGATTAGALAVGSAATSGTAAAAGRKRGGRGLVMMGEAKRNEPFVVTTEGEMQMMPVSCMSNNSQPKSFQIYTIHYCGSDDEAMLFVFPNDPDLVQGGGAMGEVYEIRSITDCRAAMDFEQVAFGPSNEDVMGCMSGGMMG